MIKESKWNNFADPQTLDGAAVAQMQSAMSLDWALRGALMPDAHKGYALPIGAVVETQDMIVPAWVGYDIGCGMSASYLSLTREDVKEEGVLEAIRDAILSAVPVGNNRHKESQDPGVEKRIFDSLSELGKQAFAQRAKLQLGTLGGGNHFIELGYGEKGDLVLTIHSGSRGFGHGTAERYMKAAAFANGVTRGNMEQHFGISSNSELGINYINDATLAQEYALANRQIMSNLAIAAISKTLGKDVKITQFINRNHNHVDRVSHNKFIHRKGATHAEDGMMGVIPGNMRDGCFIVKGKGNNDSLCSSSHGAGRVLSRAQAKKNLDFSEFEKQMKGIAGVVTEKTLDESPDAYKNIFDVMDMQKDLVEVVDYIKPLVNVKG